MYECSYNGNTVTVAATGRDDAAACAHDDLHTGTGFLDLSSIEVHEIQDDVSDAETAPVMRGETFLENEIMMKNAKSILEARRDEIGRNAKIDAIHAWAKEFFAGVDDDVINSTDDVSVGGSVFGWCFETDIQSSFLTVDCDTFENSEWRGVGVLRLLFIDIDAATIGQMLADHFSAVISDAKFIKI